MLLQTHHEELCAGMKTMSTGGRLDPSRWLQRSQGSASDKVSPVQGLKGGVGAGARNNMGGVDGSGSEGAGISSTSLPYPIHAICPLHGHDPLAQINLDMPVKLLWGKETIVPLLRGNLQQPKSPYRTQTALPCSCLTAQGFR